MKQYLSKNSTVIGRRETCRPSSNRNQTVSAVFFFFPQMKSGRSVRGNAAQLTGSEELKVEWNPSCLLSSSEGGSCTRQTLHLPLSFLLPRGIKATQHWWRGSRSLISYLILLYILLFGYFFFFFSLWITEKCQILPATTFKSWRRRLVLFQQSENKTYLVH